MANARKLWAACLQPKPKPFGSNTKAAQSIQAAINPTEDMAHQNVMEWAALTYRMPDGKTLADYLHHSPNGGHRVSYTNSKGQRTCPEGAKLKAMGAKDGIPDLQLLMARGGYFGLYIEIKRERGGRVSVSQRDMINLLTEQGYLCVVCHGDLECIKVLKKYMAWPFTITQKMQLEEANA